MFRSREFPPATPARRCDEAVDTAYATSPHPYLPPSDHGSARRARGGQLCRRTQLLRGLACRSMCERSGHAAQRVLRRRPGIEHRACPKRSAGTWAIGACSLVPCLHEQERNSPAGARPGLGITTQRCRFTRRASLPKACSQSDQIRLKPIYILHIKLTF